MTTRTVVPLISPNPHVPRHPSVAARRHPSCPTSSSSMPFCKRQSWHSAIFRCLVIRGSCEGRRGCSCCAHRRQVVRYASCTPTTSPMCRSSCSVGDRWTGCRSLSSSISLLTSSV
uniref:Uncharacterized protein n=1 Tax=Arundo donax TaxID=35708 RepID=A0A0A9D6E5_ARUDO